MKSNKLQLFKKDWERAAASMHFSLESIKKLVNSYIKHEIKEIILIKNGCANCNYKIDFVNAPSILLRIYLRDSSALLVEQSLLQLLYEHLPVSQILFADAEPKNFSHAFALMEFMPGKLMRDVIMLGDESSIADCANSAGEYLAVLRGIKFSQAGFILPNLKIRPFSENEKYLAYVYQLLNEPVVKDALGRELNAAISQLIFLNMEHIPQDNTANLTHADYDPSNLLVIEKNGRWQISAILDWEFASAITYLLDMGMFLRYASFLPELFEKNFVRALETHSEPLPSDWKKSAKLMDILCLLQLLNDHSKIQKPVMHHDIIYLLRQILKEWPSY